MGRFIEKWTALWKSLGFRISLSVGAILLASYVIFIYLVLDLQQEFYFGQIIREAERFSAAVINATNHSMLLDDREATRNIITNMAKEQEISDIRIYDHEGVIKFSNQSNRDRNKSRIKRLRLASRATQKINLSVKWSRTADSHSSSRRP